MDLTFALIATLWFPYTPPQVYVLDHGLTGEDCIIALTETKPIIKDGIILSCEE